MSDLLTYKGYFGSAHYSAADEVFYGKLEGIDDLINFEGNSVKELLRAFNEAVEDYLDTCKEIGKAPNKTYKGSFNVRIPAELHRNAALFAASKDISLNDFVKTAIQSALMVKRTWQSDLSPNYSSLVAEEAAPYKMTPKKRSKAAAGKNVLSSNKASAGNKVAKLGSRKGKKS
jgi:predicted HicB family RNase H-like nuclease